jgi:acetylornithine deacetylase/succinyl-diaminopimelate desuccinylase-like protein
MPSQNTPDLGDVFAYVDEHRQDFLDRLIAYLRMPSISAHGLGIAEVAAYIAEVMNRIGLAARIIPTAGWPMVLAERNDAPGAPTVILW